MQQLVLRFDSARKLEQYLLDELQNGGIFCATTEDLRLGEAVCVTICLPDVPEGVSLSATVIWRRRPTERRSSLVPGVGLGFDETSSGQLEFLLSHIDGRVQSTRRQWPRHQLEIPVELNARGRVYLSTTKDIGLGGMFVRYDAPCEIGKEVELDAFPEGPGKPMRLHGTVAWVRGGDRDPGFGLAFPPRDDELRRRVEQLIIASAPDSQGKMPDHARSTATLWRKPRNKRDS
jgi:Tfp pilus assembly protein PilZ